MIIEKWRMRGTFKRVRVCDGKVVIIGIDTAKIIEGNAEREVKGSWMCATCCGGEVLLGGEGGLSDGSEKREVGACDCKDRLAYALLDPFALIIKSGNKRKEVPLNWYAPNLSWGKYLAVASYDGKAMLIDEDVVWEENFPGSVLSVRWFDELLAVGVWRRGGSSVWVYKVKEEPNLLGAALLPSFVALTWIDSKLVVATQTRIIIYLVNHLGLDEVVELNLEEEIVDVDSSGRDVFVVTESGLRAFRVLL